MMDPDLKDMYVKALRNSEEYPFDVLLKVGGRYHYLDETDDDEILEAKCWAWVDRTLGNDPKLRAYDEIVMMYLYDDASGSQIADWVEANL